MNKRLPQKKDNREIIEKVSYKVSITRKKVKMTPFFFALIYGANKASC